MAVFIVMLLAPQAVWAKHHRKPAPPPVPVDYGIGLLCPSYAADQLSVYSSYGDNRISADTIVFTPTIGYTLKSQKFLDMKDAGTQVFEGYCDKHWPGLRIDARTDRWVQVGGLWAPTGQDWDYVQWADVLQNAAVLHALGSAAIYDGSEDDTLPQSFDEDAPHGTVTPKSDLRPIRFEGDYVLVEVGRRGKFGDGCAALPAAQTIATAVTGWVKYVDEEGKPLLMPRKPNGC